MICSLCTKTALYVAGKKGFCGDHRDAAVKATAADKRRVLSEMGIDNDDMAVGRKSEGPAKPWQGWNFES